MKTLVRLAGLLVVIAIAGAWWVHHHIHTPVQPPAVPYQFSIAQGSKFRDIARQLADARVLPDAWSLVLWSRLQDKPALVKAGSYELMGAVSPAGVLELISKGDKRLDRIVLIEGWTFSQIRKALNDHPGLRHDTRELGEAEILQKIGASETRAEGLFFPDTYHFSQNSSDIILLKNAYRKMQGSLQSVWDKRAGDLPLKNPYEALILASIIEKETGSENDRGMIAAVFSNRLKSGMRLQTDPTVIYGMGERFDGNLRKQDLLTDHEYNTYTRPGLPPTPIAMPGLASLQAALHPDVTDALYFVAKGDGGSHFSSSLDEHNRAVARYQKQ